MADNITGFGAWIPVEVMTNKNLTQTDKLLFAIIGSFTDGCWMNNPSLQSYLGVGQTTVSASISNLAKCGYITISNDGMRRTLRITPITTPEAQPEEPPEAQPEENELVEKVVECLNKTTGKRYRATSESVRSHILARIREGATFDEFQEVIEKMNIRWRNTDMAQYLRPCTLFGTKFEDYLNSAYTTFEKMAKKDDEEEPLPF